MYMTAFMPDNAIFRTLFEYGADPNKKSQHGVTPFMGLFASIFVDKKCKRIKPENYEEWCEKCEENGIFDYSTFEYDVTRIFKSYSIIFGL